MIRRTRRALIVLSYFCAVSAVAGGVLGVAANGAGVPLEYLQGTPFTSYLIPGLILGIVIGGTQTLAAITTQRDHPYSHIASTVAGFGMIIWIFVQLAITGYVWLQTLYLAFGITEIALVLLLLGMLRPLAETRSHAQQFPQRHDISHGSSARRAGPAINGSGSSGQHLVRLPNPDRTLERGDHDAGRGASSGGQQCCTL